MRSAVELAACVSAPVDGQRLAELDGADEQEEHDRHDHREFDRGHAAGLAAQPGEEPIPAIGGRSVAPELS